MKTKRFLLATSGATVDGRTIQAEDLNEMAKSYDPEVYSAMLNIEHIRGFSGEGPFKAYGRVLELETADITVNFNGEDEQRTALYGIFNVTEDAKKLNDAGQKLYPSIEIHPDFAGKGFAYLMGCALTDSPASIATQQLKFSTSLTAAVPGVQTFSREDKGDAALLEFPDVSEGGETSNFLSGLTGVLNSFADKFGGKPDDKTPAKTEAKTEGAGGAFDMAAFTGVMTQFGEGISKDLNALREENRETTDALSVRLTKMEKVQETTPSQNHAARPTGAGASGNVARTNF